MLFQEEVALAGQGCDATWKIYPIKHMALLGRPFIVQILGDGGCRTTPEKGLGRSVATGKCPSLASCGVAGQTNDNDDPTISYEVTKVLTIK